MRLLLVAAILPLFLVACASTPLPDVLPALGAADPMLGVTRAHYHSVIVDYTHREPVEPENWRRLNERQSPSGAGS